MKALTTLHRWLEQTRKVDFLAPLTLRLYLVPVFWMAGTNKLANMEGTIAWFGNAEWGLGLPFPTLLAWLATVAETGGALALLVGLAVRWAVIPLMATMVVAALTVHWENGWLAIAEGSSQAGQRLTGLLEWLSAEHPGRYAFVTELGRPVVLNNGIEFAATYFVMLLALFYLGGGRYISIDYWLDRRLAGRKHPC